MNPVRTGLLDRTQKSVGSAALATREKQPVTQTPVAVDAVPPGPTTAAPLRHRATITIDIDAFSADEAERESMDIRAQFELLKRTHPSAELAFQRRKPRTGRRPPTPAVVVALYVDD